MQRRLLLYERVSTLTAAAAAPATPAAPASAANAGAAAGTRAGGADGIAVAEVVASGRAARHLERRAVVAERSRCWHGLLLDCDSFLGLCRS